MKKNLLITGMLVWILIVSVVGQNIAPNMVRVNKTNVSEIDAVNTPTTLSGTTKIKKGTALTLTTARAVKAAKPKITRTSDAAGSDETIGSDEPGEAYTTLRKCGVNTFSVSNDCSSGGFRNVYWQCYDGYEVKRVDDVSCRPSETWQEKARASCKNRCTTIKDTTRALTKSITLVRCKNEEVTALYKELRALTLKLKESSYSTDTAENEEIRQKIKELRTKISEAEKKCKRDYPYTDVISIEPVPVCVVPDDLKKRHEAAWKRYETALAGFSNADITATNADEMAAIKNEIAEVEKEINKYKKNCRVRILPVPTAVDRSVAITTAAPSVVDVDCNTIDKLRKELEILSDEYGSAPDDEKKDIEKKMTDIKRRIEILMKKCTRVETVDDCRIDSAIITELEKLEKMYGSTTDSGGRRDIEAKIISLKKKMEKERNRCLSVTVPSVTNTGDIVRFYKEKMVSVLASGEDVDTQIGSLRELRGEIDEVIRQLLRRKKEVHADEISGLVEEIVVRPMEIQVDSMSVATNASIVTSVGKRNIKIVPLSRKVDIRDGSVTASAKEIKIRDGKISVGNSKQLTVMPSDAVRKIPGRKKRIELITVSNKPVYDIDVTEDKKLLGVLPVKVEKNIKVDGTTNEIIEEEKPWWSRLAI